jgi:ribosome-associated protein
VLWDVARTTRLGEAERARVLAKLANRIDKDGVLHVVADDERSQARNRALAVLRLRALVEAALVVPRPRRKTRPTRASKERRIGAKRHRATVKSTRRRPPDE